MIEFTCWGCGKSLKAKPELAGRKCKCNKCERVNTVPGEPTGKMVAEEEAVIESDEAATKSGAELIKLVSTRKAIDNIVTFLSDATVGLIKMAALMLLVIVCIVPFLAFIACCMSDPTVLTDSGGYTYNFPKAHSQLIGVVGWGFACLFVLGVALLLVVIEMKNKRS